MKAEGLVTKRSRFDPEETMTRLEAEVRARGMAVFARIDHAAGAAAVALPLRPSGSGRLAGKQGVRLPVC